MELIATWTHRRRNKPDGHLQIIGNRPSPSFGPWRYWMCLILAGLPAILQAGQLADLKSQTELTPESFLRGFADFTYELGDQVQDADTFLQRKRGDCDDFASLASSLLTERGYKTKLVVVMMEQQTHVVCFVRETAGFLDFNRRRDASPVVASDGTLEDIAQKVSDSFRSKWRMASEFKFQDRAPVYLDSVFAFGPSPAPSMTKSPVAEDKLLASAESTQSDAQASDVPVAK